MILEEDVVFEEQRLIDPAIESEPDLETPMVEPSVDDINVVRGSLETLIDLHDTITYTGVSVNEIGVLKRVKSDLSNVSITLNTKVSIESFEYLVSETRSELNKVASLESVKETIIATIKAWVSKLIEWLAEAIQWGKRMLISFELYRKNLDKYHTAITQGQASYQLLYNNLSTPALGRVEPQLTELRRSLLTNPSLPRCETALLAFGGGAKGDKGQKVDFAAITKAGESIVKYYEEFAKLLNANKVVDLSSLPKGNMGRERVLKRSVTMLEEALVLSNNEEYFFDELPRYNIKPDTFEDQYRAVIKRDIINFSPQYETFVQLAKVLRSIRKFEIGDDPDLIAEINDSINYVSETMIQLKTSIDLYRKVNTIEAKVAATFINFFTGAVGIFVVDRSNFAMGDRYDRIVNDAKKSLERIKLNLGIL